ncbi:MAG: PIN domain-containing protein [Thermodesulfovibrionaceae bacterium]
MSLIIFIFLISLTIATVSLIIPEISSLQPYLQGILIFLVCIPLTFLVYAKIKKLKEIQILLGFLGVLLGATVGLLLSLPSLILYLNINSSLLLFITYIISMSFTYGGLILGLRSGKNIKLSEALALVKKDIVWEEPKVLDTNVLIDGRIADLIDLGFIKGTILVPRFILKEIQHIADSPDPLRRAKGRRALDILQRIQKAERVRLEIIEKDIPEIKEVDIKLAELCRTLKGSLITNDLNLAKLAQLRGISVLNLNELAMAMRSPVMPGEVLSLFIIKEGKEPDQGVAYLDDGTMVVVEEGKKFIGQTIDVVIHSVLQTSSGRMVFGKPKSEQDLDEQE